MPNSVGGFDLLPGAQQLQGTNQSGWSTTGDQRSAIGLASLAAQGKVPSQADFQQRAGLQQAQAAAAAQAASTRGNFGLAGAQHAAMATQAGLQQQAVNQGAALRAQEQQAALSQYGNLAGQERSQDLQGSQLSIQQAQANAQLAQAQQQANQQSSGDILGGIVGTAMKVAPYAAMAFSDANAKTELTYGDMPVGTSVLQEPGGPARWKLREEPNFILAVNERTGEMGKIQPSPLTPSEMAQAMAPHGAGPLTQHSDMGIAGMAPVMKQQYADANLGGTMSSIGDVWANFNKHGANSAKPSAAAQPAEAEHEPIGNVRAYQNANGTWTDDATPAEGAPTGTLARLASEGSPYGDQKLREAQAPGGAGAPWRPQAAQQGPVAWVPSREGAMMQREASGEGVMRQPRATWGEGGVQPPPNNGPGLAALGYGDDAEAQLAGRAPQYGVSAEQASNRLFSDAAAKQEAFETGVRHATAPETLARLSSMPPYLYKTRGGPARVLGPEGYVLAADPKATGDVAVGTTEHVARTGRTPPTQGQIDAARPPKSDMQAPFSREDVLRAVANDAASMPPETSRPSAAGPEHTLSEKAGRLWDGFARGATMGLYHDVNLGKATGDRNTDTSVERHPHISDFDPHQFVGPAPKYGKATGDTTGTSEVARREPMASFRSDPHAMLPGYHPAWDKDWGERGVSPTPDMVDEGWNRPDLANMYGGLPQPSLTPADAGMHAPMAPHYVMPEQTITGEPPTTSDARAKQVESRHPGFAAARQFMDTLEPHAFLWRDKSVAPNPRAANSPNLGVMAQQVEQSPWGNAIVQRDPATGYRTLDKSALIGALAASAGALKHQQDEHALRIEAMERALGVRRQ
jgi:hypothetical protein